MKKILFLIILGFFCMKFSPFIMLFLMYGGIYLLSNYDPALKVKMNEHQAQMVDMFGTYFHDIYKSLSAPMTITYFFYLLLVISGFIGIKMLIREVKGHGRTKEA
ncbi:MULTISPECIES: hypothetical protein [Bacilli]|uniref:hypothetical protein n=1 Tax=Bacilli TaxID=91061 RepID=UPI002555D40A|nr:hypothetical protein [Streptococcus agalactiae]MDK8746873.1 hypothetical protein [Streptococcus agalactiae]